MSLDLVADASYRSQVFAVRPSAGGGDGDKLLTASRRRRRPPSPEEQARRVEWGKRWGAMVSHVTRGIREDRR